MQQLGAIKIEVQPRLATLFPERWPVTVPPADDELLSSWLNRLAFAHGVPARHFLQQLAVGSILGVDTRTPVFLLSSLRDQTGVKPDDIVRMSIGFEDWRVLTLPLRYRTAGKMRATWLQFCPQCLAEDKSPYFRRSWRRATVMICRGHRAALLDRCPVCRHGLAPFDQVELRPQHYCACCAFDLRTAKPPVTTKSTRETADLLDDLVKLESIDRTLTQSTLVAKILRIPALQADGSNVSFANLSTAERLRCLGRVKSDLKKYLAEDPDPRIAARRRVVLRAGGAARALDPLVRVLSRTLSPMIESDRRRHRIRGGQTVDLGDLLSAYRAVAVRWNGRLAEAANPQKLSSSSVAVSSPASFSESSSSDRPKASSRSASD